jgi:hypothetical protein
VIDPQKYWTAEYDVDTPPVSSRHSKKTVTVAYTVKRLESGCLLFQLASPDSMKTQKIAG